MAFELDKGWEVLGQTEIDKRCFLYHPHLLDFHQPLLSTALYSSPSSTPQPTASAASRSATTVFCLFWPRPPSSLKPDPPAYLLAPPPFPPHTQLALERDKRSEVGWGPAALSTWLYP